MSIPLHCGQCDQRYKVKDELAGRSVKCKNCGKLLQIPASPGPAPPSRATTTAATPAARTAPRPAAEPPPPALDIYGFDDAPASRSGHSSGALAGDDDAPPLPRAGTPSRPRTREEKKAFEKRVKANDRKKGSFSQSAFGASFGAVFMVCIFGLRVYNKVNRPLRAITRVTSNAQKEPGQARAKRQIAPASPPTYPDLTEGQAIEPGVRYQEVRLGPPTTAPPIPGQRGCLWLYLPDGQHAARSLPCILIAGAGSNLITGMNLADADRKEHLPYVRAGIAVLGYELDGAADDHDDVSNVESLEAFLAVEAGLVNARNALGFLAIKVPEVDPERIYAVGHSSAGTLALLLAEREPRIKGAVAFAPAPDTKEFFPPQFRDSLTREIPGSDAFFTRYNPRANLASVHCPIFLFHAQDDSNVLVAESHKLKADLEQAGKAVTLEVVPTGDHYDGMLAQGIPRALAWIKTQAGVP